jgi:hypothetical protein
VGTTIRVVLGICFVIGVEVALACTVLGIQHLCR